MPQRERERETIETREIDRAMVLYIFISYRDIYRFALCTAHTVYKSPSRVGLKDAADKGISADAEIPHMTVNTSTVY